MRWGASPDTTIRKVRLRLVKPKVSVIVPVYNVEPYIRKCLETLTAQTLDEIEILVVNDGSPDDSQPIVDEFVARFPAKVRSVIKQNGGLSSARNLGIELATGDYIGFVDGDDYVACEMFEELWNRADQTGADIVVCGYSTVDLNTGEHQYHRQGHPRFYGKSLAEHPDYLHDIAPYVWNKIFRKSLFDETGVRFPLGKLFEDIPVTYSLFAAANKIEKVQRSLYRYVRSRAGSITHAYSPRNLEMLETLALLNEHYKDRGIFERFRSHLLLLNFRHIFNRFIELPHYDGIAIKQRFLGLAWSHLDAYFPEWRDDARVAEVYGHAWRYSVFHQPIAARAYALAPWFTHAVADEFVKGRKAAAAFFARFGSSRRLKLTYARHLRTHPVDRNTALFESFHGKNISDSPFYLMRDLARRGSHRILVTTTDVEFARDYLKRNNIDATPVLLGSHEYARALATAGYLVSNVSFPSYFVKRPEQLYLNTWHGTPLKTLGKSMPWGLKDMPNIQANFFKTDYLLFTNEFTRDHMMHDYMLTNTYSGTPLVMGSPRNSAFFDEARARAIREELGLTGKRVIVYMPTWRGGSSRDLDIDAYAMQIEDHLSAIDSALDDDTVFLVKYHTLVSELIPVGDYGHVRKAPSQFETYELLAIADMLVTDYSSVFFDFANTRREIVLFAYDYDDYLAERDTYFPMTELPFPILKSVGALVDHLTAARPFVADADYERFVERFAGLDGPNAAAGINDLVLADPKLTGEPASDSRPTREAPEVDLVFVPYLTRSGQAVFENLLEQGYRRDDVVFVFSGSRFIGRANAYLYRRYRDEGLDLNIAPTGGRMVLSATQSFLLWIHRHFGIRTAVMDQAYLHERHRLWGDMRIRSATDVTGYTKFSEFADELNRQVASESQGPNR